MVRSREARHFYDIGAYWMRSARPALEQLRTIDHVPESSVTARRSRSGSMEVSQNDRVKVLPLVRFHRVGVRSGAKVITTRCVHQLSSRKLLRPSLDDVVERVRANARDL